MHLHAMKLSCICKAGECELDGDFDMNGDNSAQLLAAANAANNAQAIIATLLEEYENIFDDDSLQRCSISADSRIVNSGSDDSTDDENLDVKQNGFHNSENGAVQDTVDDQERVLSGKLSESSGYGGSDLYDYKVQASGGNDSDGSPSVNNGSTVYSKPRTDTQALRDFSAESSSERNKLVKVTESLANGMDSPKVTAGESYRSMGEILSSMDPGPPLPITGPESSAEKSISKLSGSGVKRSTFWSRSAHLLWRSMMSHMIISLVPGRTSVTSLTVIEKSELRRLM